jgi:hypothetical protein
MESLWQSEGRRIMIRGRIVFGREDRGQKGDRGRVERREDHGEKGRIARR